MKWTEKWTEFFGHELARRAESATVRQRTWHVDRSSTVLCPSDGRELINFGTNDYLGIRHDWRLNQAVKTSLALSGVGAGASPLVTGYSTALAELEQRLAQWQHAEAALVFTSGFAMNVGVISALVTSDDLILSDQLNHASLIDGCRLSRAHKRVFPHNDVAAVGQILKAERHRYQRALLVCESIYSMDGDCAPLAQLTELCEQYEVGMLVDEAHATGVYGQQGCGLGGQLGLSHRWLGKLGTLSKAVGTSGGYVVGSRALIEFLVNNCRSYIYSTAMAPPVVAATLAAVQWLKQLDDRRARLLQTSGRLRAELKQRWPIPAGDSPIIPVIVGPSEAALEWRERLRNAGCFVPAIRPPTVPAQTARLRISLSAMHTDQQIAQLLACLTEQPLG